MRILFLTNFYVARGWGGEDQSCRQVVEGFNQRGHKTLVLTSMHDTNNVPVETDGVSRSLFLEMDLVPLRNSITFFTERRKRERLNLQTFQRVMEQFEPDIIFIWGMWNLPRSLPAAAEARFPDRVVYRFATYWPTLPSQFELYWRAPGRTWYGRVAKQVLGRVALAIIAQENRRPALMFKHAICVSAATRQKLVEVGVPVAHARVIHTGLDPQRYAASPEDGRPQADPGAFRLLYAGRLVAEKGVDTAIKALETIANRQGLGNIHVTVAGAGLAGYESYLRHLVDQAGLNEYVAFVGHVPAEEMPQFLRQFDAVLVPSIWPEPFSRMVLEGMLSGLVVVATPTGGTPEILVHGENGLLFAPGDADDLAQQILALAANPKLRKKLALAGQQTVVQRFTHTRMMDEIEGYLQEVAQAGARTKVSQPERPEGATAAAARPTVSVIIPTFNRKALLREALGSLARQTYPFDLFEVIVVDDGSTDGTETITTENYPFVLRYFAQTNQGDAAARNVGARQSQADILVFVDDDIMVEPDYLAELIDGHDQCPNRVTAGASNLWLPDSTPLFHAFWLASHANESSLISEFPFSDVCSNNMCVSREAYFRVGMMQALDFSGSSLWCDVEFNYRAYRQGFEFRRTSKAVCWHRDYTARSLTAYRQRMRVAAYRAVVLFQKHPELLSHLPMFTDKTPINWHKDPPRLILRKLARYVLSSRPALWGMEKFVASLEKRYPASRLLSALCRYIVGGHIFQGYREGLGEFGPVDSVGERALLA